MRYRLFGIDLDGTLLDNEGQISNQNRTALGAARGAGVMVVPCTGRGWVESKRLLADIPDLGLGVFVTGASVVEIATGRTVNVASLDPRLALSVVEQLRDLPEAVLAFRDAEKVGHDYLVTGSGQLSANTSWWFELNEIVVCHQRRVTEADLHHTLRLGCVAPHRRLAPIVERLRVTMGDRIMVHSFAAVQRSVTEEQMHVLEVFAPGVDKWRGLRWIAQQRSVSPHQIATFGDQINDVSMLCGAGCGIAMANGHDVARSIADYVTQSNQEHGVAHAIGQLLSGAWS